MQHPKSVAIVTDWMYGGGSEKVVEQLHLMFPEAPIYTSYCSAEWRERLNDKVVTGYLQRWPFKQLRKFLPLLRQLWFARLDLSSFDLVISVSGNGEAKFARASKQGAKHICYCNTPVHFYWRHYEEYLANPGVRPAWLARLGLKLLVKPLRDRDFKVAQKVDMFLANSSHIQSDIKLYYGRESIVVFPPVDITRFANSNIQPSSTNSLSFVTHGRLVPAKKVDILINACNQLGLSLTVIGKGPDYDRLAGLAGPTIAMKGFVADDDLPTELRRHSAFLFASYEDFGIAPIEAMAAGLPVIAYKAGGALDYVLPGKTGEFFEEQTTRSVVKVLTKFDRSIADSSIYKPSQLLEQAERFSIAEFRKRITDILAN